MVMINQMRSLITVHQLIFSSTALKHPQLIGASRMRFIIIAKVNTIIRKPMIAAADRARTPHTRSIPQISSIHGRTTADALTPQ